MRCIATVPQGERGDGWAEEGQYSVARIARYMKSVAAQPRAHAPLLTDLYSSATNTKVSQACCLVLGFDAQLGASLEASRCVSPPSHYGHKARRSGVGGVSPWVMLFSVLVLLFLLYCVCAYVCVCVCVCVSVCVYTRCTTQSY